MKKFILYFLVFILCSKLSAQIGYTFAGVAGAFTPNAAPTVLHAASVDDATSASTAIGFTFQYGCINYTTFQVSTNGVMFLGTAAAGTNLTNNLTASADRPAIAPLWDDLKTSTTGNVNYKLTGITPNRILTVEWLNMLWSFSGAAAAVSFQAILYETSNRIDFVYRQDPGAIVINGASIGLGGQASGDFYSLNGTGAAPAASKLVETTSLSTKPATGQIYRWDPILCAGVPVPGAAVATPSYACAAYNTTLTLSGATPACGLTYQWQSAPALAGPWTNIGGATTSTAAVAVAATTFYRCILLCGASSATSTPATATIAAVAGGCGICGGVNSITLPYSVTGTTTCGAGNDITAANVVPCGSGLYFGGEDVVYSFTPATTGQVSITFSTSGTNASVTYWTGCPLTGACKWQQAGMGSFGGAYSWCINVTAGVAVYVVIDSWPAPTCLGYDLSISGVVTNTVGCALSTYVASPTAYSFDVFAGTTCPSTDDVLYSAIALTGFPFCYTGATYWGGYIASNGAFVFPAVPCFPNIQTNQYAAPGIPTGWSITAAAPVNNTSIPRNAILAPWHDIDPSLGGVIRYGTLGVAPNRRFVVSFENIPMFSCGVGGGAAQFFSGQIKLFETTNNIEIHVKNKQLCTTWNGGNAVMGLHSYNALTYIPPVNMVAHNFPTQWTMTNTAYRFSSLCAATTCAVLPVHFKSFYGERSNAVNHLYWETSEEDNIKSFSIERSIDAQNFTEIGKVASNNKPSKHQFDDKTAMPGTLYYYRVASIENFGAVNYTELALIGANEGEIAVSGIFPNPVKGDFTLSVDSKIVTTITVNIYDAIGKLVKTYIQDVGTGVSQLNLYCGELPAGIYVLETTNTGKEVVAKQKMIKID